MALLISYEKLELDLYQTAWTAKGQKLTPQSLRYTLRKVGLQTPAPGHLTEERDQLNGCVARPAPESNAASKMASMRLIVRLRVVETATAAVVNFIIPK